MRPPLLEGYNLSIRRRDKLLLNDISFRIFPGERITLSGASGAGKTLFCRALAFLEIFSEGELLFQERSPFSISSYLKEVLYVPARPRFFQKTVSEALIFHDREKVEKLLDKAKIPHDFLEKKIRDLSSGQVQYLAVLRALLFEPKILLLDEVTASCDLTMQEHIEDLLFDWQQEQDLERSFLLITHQTDQIERLSLCRWQMRNGGLHFE
jgi:putative ABC transport system ATP-binding protein